MTFTNCLLPQRVLRYRRDVIAPATLFKLRKSDAQPRRRLSVRTPNCLVTDNSPSLISPTLLTFSARSNTVERYCSSAATEEGPLFDYISHVESKQLEADPHQARIAEKLQSLHEHLRGYEPPSLEYLDDLKRRQTERIERIEAKKRKWVKENYSSKESVDVDSLTIPDFEADEPPLETFEAPPGFYMFGPVGCGKTMLMDLFFESMPTERKMRVHFSTFLLLLQSEMNKWRVRKNDEEMSPIESVARGLLRNNWLICFDEIQHSDFGTTVVLERLISFLVSHGAVLVSTSNRPPHQLGASGFSQEQELSMEEGSIGDFAQFLIDTNGIHEIISPTDYRTKSLRGTQAYYSVANGGKDEFDETLRQALDATILEPGQVLVYTRKLNLPSVSTTAGIASFTFRQLCKDTPMGPADYLSICNSFPTIFIADIPALSIRDKNEAKRLLSFVDAAYETKTKVFFLAATDPEDLFQLIPDQGEDAEVRDAAQLETLEEIAYDLKTDLKRGKMADLRTQGILTGEDEIFSFKRCISRIHEMNSVAYQKTDHRPIDFAPFVASREEEAIADARRKGREAARREDMKTVYPKPTNKPMLNLSTEWGPGSELYHESWNATVPGEEMEGEGGMEARKLVRKHIKVEKDPVGWWEELVDRAKKRKVQTST